MSNINLKLLGRFQCHQADGSPLTLPTRKAEALLAYLALAKAHLTKALNLEPDNAGSHSFIAEYYIYARDFEQAEFHADRAMTLNPTLPDGYAMKALACSCLGRIEESLEFADKCITLDPHHPYAGWIVGDIYRNSEQYEKAIATYRSLPHMPLSVHLQLAICFAGAGKLEQANSEMTLYQERARQEMPNYPESESDWLDYLGTIFIFRSEADFQRVYSLALTAGLLKILPTAAEMLPSIAVLPFENLSDDSTQEFFARGITSDIINLLSKFRYLQTASAYSSALYQDRARSIAGIAAELGVRYILDGGIRKPGNMVRIGVQLIDLTSNTTVWSEQFDRELNDIFAIQDEITMNVASALKVRLLDGERSRVFDSGLQNFKAWKHCVLAAELSDTYIRENITLSRQLSRQALELEPQYKQAWAILGWSHWQEAYCGWSEDIEISLQEAETAAQRSLQIDSDYWDGLILMSFVHIMRDEPGLAINAAFRAADSAPGTFDAVILTGYSLNFAGRHKETVAVYEKSQRLCLSKVYPNRARLVGAYAYQNTGRFADALKSYREGIAVEPESPICRYYLMDFYLHSGEPEKARQMAHEINTLTTPMKIEGLVRSLSHDQNERERFRSNMNQMGFF